MGHVGTLDTAVLNASGTSMVVTIPAAVPAGEALVAHVVLTGTGGTMPTVLVTDPRGNTWTSAVAEIVGATASSRVLVSKASTAYVAGDALVFTFATRGKGSMSLDRFTGVASAAVGVTAAVAHGTSTSLTVGPVTSTRAPELVLATHATGGERTWTPSDGFAVASLCTSTSGTAERGGVLVWREDTITGPRAATTAMGPSATAVSTLCTLPLVVDPDPPTGPTVTVWDGTTRQPATVLGVWDGTTVQPATVSVTP